MELTEALLEQNTDKKDLESKGGLDFETFEALQRRGEIHQQNLMEYKQEIKSFYGSLKNAPNSVGPCQKIGPVIGTKNAIVLLAEFKDVKHSNEANAFKDLFFNKDNKQSLRNYYLEASWNQLDINGNVNEKWYTSNNNRTDYLDDPTNFHYPKAQKLVIETIEMAKNSGNIDFSPYAKDGKIEILIIVYSGIGQDTKLNINYIRPHHYHLLEPLEVQEGIFADDYIIIPELPIYDVGCICHEIGHVLGLPDLYLDNYGPIVGSWCLMGVGCWNNEGRTPAHPSAWCKLHLGWTEPKLLDQIPQLQDIPAVIDDKTIYKVLVQDSDGKEYFLLENRQQKGFDEYLPSSGLLIWHVDETACIKQNPNFDPKHFFMTLKQSNGKNDLAENRIEIIKKAKIGDKPPKGAGGDEGDPFPGITVNRTFNDYSNPNSRTYKGNKSFVEVVSISDSNKLMNAQIGISSKSDKLEMRYKPEIISKTIDPELKQEIINLFFINLLSKPEEKNSYDDGVADGRKEYLEELIVKEYLDLYQNGYRLGYSQGYEEARRLFKKFVQ
jgi:immune inhibitor A